MPHIVAQHCVHVFAFDTREAFETHSKINAFSFAFQSVAEKTWEGVVPKFGLKVHDVEEYLFIGCHKKMMVVQYCRTHTDREDGKILNTTRTNCEMALRPTDRMVRENDLRIVNLLCRSVKCVNG
jgi:hypothetical protein